MDFKRVQEKAEGHKPAISRFLRDLIALPSESCQEREVILRIKREMETVGFDRVEIDPMGNVLGYIGNGRHLIAMDARNDMAGIKDLEKELLAQNATHKDWECTEQLMRETRDGRALYMHCLPADISGVSCKEGEVAASVFDRYRDLLYREASYKPYAIAAMIFLARVKQPADVLANLLSAGRPRVS